MRFSDTVATEVSRLLAGEAAAIHAARRPATVQEEVAGLQAGILAAAGATGPPGSPSSRGPGGRA